MRHPRKPEGGTTRSPRPRTARTTSSSRIRRRAPLGVEQLEPRRVLAPLISELLANNTDEVQGLRDFEGTLQDWIEIYNPDIQAVDLTGWKLKDGSKTWTFPSVMLGPGEFRIVFASDKNLTTPELHTNFKLSRDPGEYLGLLDNLGHEDTGGGGHFLPDAPFPGMPRGTDHDDFVTRAAGIVHLPATGAWTFGVNSDDGFRPRITGATFQAAYGQSGTTASGDTLEFFSPRAPNDSFGVVNSLAAGDYAVELISYERGGGSDTELFAAAGTHTTWNNSFRLVGDTANGGLAVVSAPFGGAGSSSTFASLIETDVQSDMQAANNASLYSRITFDVADPQGRTE